MALEELTTGLAKAFKIYQDMIADANKMYLRSKDELYEVYRKKLKEE